MKAMTLCFALVLLAGCGGRCADRTGTFRQNAVARSGSCPSPLEGIVVDPDKDPASKGCTGTARASDDNCTETTDVTCPEENGYTFRQTGKLTFDAAGASGSGIFEFTIRDSSASMVCQGTYDVTVTKI